MHVLNAPMKSLGRRTAALTAAAAVCVGLAAAPASAHSVAPAMGAKPDKAANAQQFDYYLALGDSLGAGYQPNTVTGTGYLSGKGYADDIAADLAARNRGIKYVNLACPGETTTSMITGGCPWPEPYANQLGAATAFLAAHRRAKILVTLDIGANDIDGCTTATGIDLTCGFTGLEQTAADVPRIMSELRRSAGRHTEFIGMTYYNPSLAAYLTGPTGQATAHLAATFLDEFNAMLSFEFRLFGARVADVAGAFGNDAFTPLVPLFPGFDVPVNVARVCQWTWMCAPKPVGPNIHANDAGYAVMAQAFEAKIQR